MAARRPWIALEAHVKTIDALVVLVLLGSVLLTRDSRAQPQCPWPEIPLYVLLPYGSPCIVTGAKCSTDYGFCRWPTGSRAGSPCYCAAPNGASVAGVIRQGL